MICTPRQIWLGWPPQGGWEGRDIRIAYMNEKKKTEIIWVRQSERKSQVGRCSTRWTSDIKMKLKGTGQKGVDRIHLAQDREIRRLF
jgi:hypothetical protein